MANASDTETAAPGGDIARKRFSEFMQILKAHAETAERGADASQALLDIIDHPKDGLKAAVDELTDEIHALREDLRAFMKVLTRRG